VQSIGRELLFTKPQYEKVIETIKHCSEMLFQTDEARTAELGGALPGDGERHGISHLWCFPRFFALFRTRLLLPNSV